MESLWRAWLVHRRGKRRRATVARFDVDADRHVFALYRSLQGGGFAPEPFRQHVVRDPKLRLISAPSLRDRVLHQAIVHELAPHFERSYIAHSYACRLGLGPQRAVLAYLAWSRRFRYRLHLDIRRYFPSVDHEVLLDLMGRKIRDARTRELLRTLVVHGGSVYQTGLARTILGEQGRIGAGLPIGSSLSQWCANLYLDGADHLVKRTLKIPGYLRYLDDLTLFSDERGSLEEARAVLEGWLWEHRRVRVHAEARVVPAREPSTYLGTRVSCAGLAPGEKLRRRMPVRVRAAAGRGSLALERSLRSYLGILGLSGGRVVTPSDTSVA